MGENLKDEVIKNYSALGYAYLGDAVYERYVREYIMESRGNMPVENYHKIALGFVKAEAQARAIDELMPRLSEEEEAVFRRGRNAKAHAAPKSSSPGEYRKATGFEALIGYLSINGRNARAEEIMKAAVDILETDKSVSS